MTRRLARLRRFLARRREDLHREQLADRVVAVVAENARRRAEREDAAAVDVDHVRTSLGHVVRDLDALLVMMRENSSAARHGFLVVRDRVEGLRQRLEAQGDRR